MSKPKKNNCDAKIAKQTFFCDVCNYKCFKLSDWNRHIITYKHQRLSNVSNNEPQFSCICGKTYKHMSSLCSHKKKCVKQINNQIASQIESQDIHQLIQYLLKENTEFKQMLIEQNKQIVHSNNQTNIHNGNNVNSNNHFNLQFFLHDTCKNAMNINDFVSSIKVNLEDLEHTGEKGYVEGISNIFIKNLNELEQHLRPLHCSDSKREVLYIKDNNEWVKETDDKPILTRAIKNIAHENIKQIKAWTQKYPDCTKPYSKKNDTYLNIVSNSMNGLTTEESLSNIHKIISKISKEVIINKKLIS